MPVRPDRGPAGPGASALRYRSGRFSNERTVSGRIAIYLYVAFIAWFFIRDRKLRPMPSGALWVPLLWLLIIGTRPVSFWFNPGLRPDSVEAYLEGSPLDAAGYLILLLLGIGILVRRRLNWAEVASANRWVAVFFLYCLISVLWSEYSFVALKRWVKDFGNVTMVLVILTETNIVAALRAMFVRYAYMVIPLSMMFIKYVPDIGRYYDPWSWQPMYRGVAGEKNALGATVAFGTLFLIWDLIDRARTRRAAAEAKETGAAAIEAPPPMNAFDIGGRVLLFGMAAWLLDKADSSNAQVCLALGSLLLFFFGRSMAGKQTLVRNLGWYSLLVLGAVMFVYLVPGVLGFILSSMGEDPTLTGRVDLWADILAIKNSELFGAGYQSFWLSSEIDKLWAVYSFKPNQAHNGYIETYVNLGFIGLGLLLCFLLSAATRLRKRMLNREPVAVLYFALLVFVLFYNWSEAMFSNLTPAWFFTLLAAMTYQSVSAEALTPAARRTKYRREPLPPRGSVNPPADPSNPPRTQPSPGRLVGVKPRDVRRA
jgi:exopolysaccharide production protein ExoQ